MSDQNSVTITPEERLSILRRKISERRKELRTLHEEYLAEMNRVRDRKQKQLRARQYEKFMPPTPLKESSIPCRVSNL
ncbi:MAG TPA: hypothetical protein VEX68_01750 [Bryobacteraceae bacterium]|nr:hypothetical protein [Bryobacteraceae bacterium]